MTYSMDDIFALKNRYQNGDVQIGKELINPCLFLCKHYRRGTGFFSSSALKAYVSAIDNIIHDKTKIDILCSPIIQDKSLLKILENNSTDSDKEKTIRKLTEKIVLVAAGFEIDPNNRDYRSKLLAFMIATNQLEIRFAIPNHFDWPTEEINDRNIYHVKVGYFDFPDETRVAFDGSFNESESGHSSHVDRTQVFRSWKSSDDERLADTINDIDSDWGDDPNNKNNNITVYTLSSGTIDIIKSLSPSTRPRNNIKQPIQKITGDIKFPEGIWQHKEKAVTTFLEKKNGILEMATGTGKTSTALEIIRHLYLSGKIKSIIISTYGTDLLNQWCLEIHKWQHKNNRHDLNKLKLFKSFSDNNESLTFLNDCVDSILVISREASALKNVLSSNNLEKLKTLIIHDEIHGFGSPTLVDGLLGSHKEYIYKLGLSATPEREYDKSGSDFITNEIGDVIFEFPLNEAIKEGILCEFDYIPLEFQLTQNDKDEYKKIFSRKASDERKGQPWPPERLPMELSRIVKKAELKPLILDDYLQNNLNILASCIIFVLDIEQGNSICNVISKYIHKYKTYYAGVDKIYLDRLASNQLDCLVACERLNEGIDIQSLNNIILIASPKSKLDTIQRIGRCLRRNPNDEDKRAKVIDLVLEQDDQKDVDNTDQNRMEWLSDISKARRIR